MVAIVSFVLYISFPVSQNQQKIMIYVLTKGFTYTFQNDIYYACPYVFPSHRINTILPK